MRLSNITPILGYSRNARVIIIFSPSVKEASVLASSEGESIVVVGEANGMKAGGEWEKVD
jgi:hypothetical protein